MPLVQSQSQRSGGLPWKHTLQAHCRLGPGSRFRCFVKEWNCPLSLPLALSTTLVPSVASHSWRPFRSYPCGFLLWVRWRLPGGDVLSHSPSILQMCQGGDLQPCCGHLVVFLEWEHSHMLCMVPPPGAYAWVLTMWQLIINHGHQEHASPHAAQAPMAGYKPCQQFPEDEIRTDLHLPLAPGVPGGPRNWQASLTADRECRRLPATLHAALRQGGQEVGETVFP